MSHSLEKEVKALEIASERLLTSAVKAGATAAEVCGSYGRSLKISMEKQDFHLASHDDGYQLGLRVLLHDKQGHGKQGFTSCNTLDESELKATSQKAIEIAGFSPGNPHFRILPTTNIPSQAPTDALWDEALFEVSLQTQKDWAQLLYREAVKDPKFRLNEGSVSVGPSVSLIANSFGTHKIEFQTAASWSLMGMAVDGENITSFDYFTRLVRNCKAVPSQITDSAKNFRNGIIQCLGKGKAESYRGIVAFAPRALLDIFVSCFSYQLNGRNVLEGTSQWKKESLGKKCLPAPFTLIDNPWLTDRMGATFFDREGTPTAKHTLITNGTLNHFFLDHYSAAGLGLTSTGHATGGPSAPGQVGSFCLNLEPGTETFLKLMRDSSKSQPEILLVHRFSGNSDPITGDFSGVAKGAQWFRGGEPAYYVSETLISGNVFEAASALVGLSSNIEIVDSDESSPYGLIDGISVTAKN